jgi:hypothetical protein
MPGQNPPQRVRRLAVDTRGQAMRRIGTIAFSLLLTSAAHAGVCSGDDTARAAASAKEARAALYALPPGEDMSGDVTDEGSRAIETFKDRLEAFAAAAMLCQSESPSAHGVKDALDRLKEKTAGEHPYGDNLAFDVDIAKSPPGLVAIKARFGIECGEDAMLMIFARRGDSWNDVLEARSKPYKSIAESWWAMGFAISKPDADGHWFVAVKHVAPWCSSTWSQISYAVLRPSGNPARPATLFERGDDIWWGNEDEGEIKAGESDFDLRFHAGSMDLGVHNREWIRHYSVHGDVVRRIAPQAENPRDFADEWVASIWKEAGEWSSPANLKRLRAVHDEAHKIRYMDYISLHACAGAPDRFQIEAEKADGMGGSYFFQVQGRDDYRMLDVTRRADPGCNLPDTVDPPLPE